MRLSANRGRNVVVITPIQPWADVIGIPFPADTDLVAEVYTDPRAAEAELVRMLAERAERIYLGTTNTESYADLTRRACIVERALMDTALTG